jgi:hypothetical protein
VIEAGKAVFHENDVRTHVLYDDAGYGWTERPSETNSVQEREAAFALANGAGLWWFDMTRTFYEDATTLDTIARMCRIASIGRPPAAPAPIAFVIDEESYSVTDFWADRYSDAIPRQLLELARIGAAHDVRLMSELPEDHDYRFLVFPNLFRVEPDRLARIRRLVQRAGGALFIGPVGLAPVLAGEPVGPARVTGLPIDLRAEACFVEIALDPGIFREEPDAPSGFGRRFWHDLRVVGDAGRVRVLGRYTDGPWPAFFDAPVGKSRVAYAADAIVPAAALRVLARDSGVPIAISTGEVFATDGTLFSVTAATAGPKRIRIRAGETITVPMAAGQTRTFLAGPAGAGPA